MKYHLTLMLQQSQNNDDQSSYSNDQSEAGDLDSEGQDEDEPDDTEALIRAASEKAVRRVKAEREAKKKAATAEVARIAEKRKRKEVNLNNLSSISTGGGDLKTAKANAKRMFSKRAPQD